MLVVSALGEKLYPLLIGKSQRPRIFKNISLESFCVVYKANKTSWLTSELFNEYLNILKNSIFKKYRKILILLDNFSGHKIPDKTNMALMFYLIIHHCYNHLMLESFILLNLN
ncbi:Tigger transposable element-derived protein 6 [Dictyocoela muelleri]|nr:Tigger transposable element-derived protein 6 [Dictyocoela muelleri]